MAEHDPETVRVGRENIARIRAQLATRSEATRHTEHQPPRSEAQVQADPTHGPEASVDSIRIDMAIANEREQLLAAIRDKDARIAHLEATLAAVVRTAAGGIGSTPQPQSTAPNVSGTDTPPDGDSLAE